MCLGTRLGNGPVSRPGAIGASLLARNRRKRLPCHGGASESELSGRVAGRWLSSIFPLGAQVGRLMVAICSSGCVSNSGSQCECCCAGGNEVGSARARGYNSPRRSGLSRGRDVDEFLLAPPGGPVSGTNIKIGRRAARTQHTLMRHPRSSRCTFAFETMAHRKKQV